MFPNPIGAKTSNFGAGALQAAITESEWLKAYTEVVKENSEPIKIVSFSQDTIFDHKVVDLQEGIKVKGNRITGTLKYVDSGKLPERWKKNWFIALEFLNIPEDATSVKVGLDPSAAGGLVEIINDPDKAGAWGITPENGKVVQKFVVKTTTPEGVKTQVFWMDEIKLAK